MYLFPVWVFLSVVLGKIIICRNDACFIIKSNVYESKIHFSYIKQLEKYKDMF